MILTNSTTGADDLGFHLLNDQYPLKELKKSVVVDEAILKEYVGTYEISPSFSITVTHDTDGLHIQATGQPMVNIYPETDSKFYLKIVEARVEFERNANNQVERLVLYQNGAVMPGKKVK